MPNQKILNNYNQILSDIGYNRDSINTVEIKPIYIPDIPVDNIPDDKENVHTSDKYIDNIKALFKNLPCTTN